MGKTTRLSFRLPSRLKRRIEKLAAAENRSVSNWIVKHLSSELPSLTMAQVGEIVRRK